jgi:hypothetical protein
MNTSSNVRLFFDEKDGQLEAMVFDFPMKIGSMNLVTKFACEDWVVDEFLMNKFRAIVFCSSEFSERWREARQAPGHFLEMKIMDMKEVNL